MLDLEQNGLCSPEGVHLEGGAKRLFLSLSVSLPFEETTKQLGVTDILVHLFRFYWAEQVRGVLLAKELETMLGCQAIRAHAAQPVEGQPETYGTEYIA